MTTANIYAIKKLQNAASHLSRQERTAAVSRAEYILSDAILSLWNSPETDKRGYWTADRQI